MVCLLLSAALLAASQDTVAVPLEDAVTRVLAVSPTIAAATGAIAAPKGLRSEALWPFPSNPTFAYGRAKRQSPGSTTYDTEWVISQDIEIGGQWIFRHKAAGKLVQSAEQRLKNAERLVALDARLAYLTLALAERRTALTDSSATFAARLADLAARQLEAGEINRLEHNAALLEAARTQSTAERAHGEHSRAAANLARLLDWGNDSLPKTVPGLDILDIPMGNIEALFVLARDRRADLAAAGFDIEAADKAVTAASLEFIPNLTLLAFGGREADTDDLNGFGIGLTIPLFHRGQTTKGFAKANRAAARAEYAAVSRGIRAEVQATTRRFARARAAERRFATEVLRAATENVTLSETALEEGLASVTDVVVLRTAAVAAQLEYLDVLAEAAEAWFELAAALSVSPEDLAQIMNDGTEQQ